MYFLLNVNDFDIDIIVQIIIVSYMLFKSFSNYKIKSRIIKQNTDTLILIYAKFATFHSDCYANYVICNV